MFACHEVHCFMPSVNTMHPHHVTSTVHWRCTINARQDCSKALCATHSGHSLIMCAYGVYDELGGGQAADSYTTLLHCSAALPCVLAPVLCCCKQHSGYKPATLMFSWQLSPAHALSQIIVPLLYGGLLQCCHN